MFVHRVQSSIDKGNLPQEKILQIILEKYIDNSPKENIMKKVDFLLHL